MDNGLKIFLKYMILVWNKTTNFYFKKFLGDSLYPPIKLKGIILE